MLPHCLIIAARVRLPELVERRGHYRGRDMDILVKCLLSFGRNWGLQGKTSSSLLRSKYGFKPGFVALSLRQITF
jgi:hypothetical protein